MSWCQIHLLVYPENVSGNYFTLIKKTFLTIYSGLQMNCFAHKNMELELFLKTSGKCTKAS